MANMQQLTRVAEHCSGYKPLQTGFTSSVGKGSCVSCETCQNFENNICKVNLFDKVLAGLDEK